VDGWLYGTTAWGGDNGFGTVFRISTAGVYQKLASFDSTTGKYPYGLILASDGAFYGTTVFGLASNAGAAFRYTLAGGIVVIHEFADSNESYASGRLYQAANGDLYGVTNFGGSTGVGTVFRMTTAGSTTVIHSFSNSDGAYPVAGVTAGADGNLYGMTLQGGPDPGYPVGVIYKIDSQDVVTMVHAFTMADHLVGSQAAFLLASDGKLYGATGSIFRLEPDDTVKIVHTMTQLEGATLVAALIEPTTGHLIGPAQFGGAGGYGTVFDCDFAGNLEVVYSFMGSPQGLNPVTGAVQGSDGSFYGTTQEGGSAGQGVIFRLDASNTLTVLHSFQNGEGSWSRGNLTFGPDGRLYGTTYASDGFANASAFAMDTLGNFDLLHTFSWDEARQINAGLLWSSDGQLWGAGLGTGPFQLASGGTVTLVPVDDPSCLGTLIESDGSLYGTSTGSVYKITGSTSETLHTFAAPNGYDLEAGLLKAADGNFYGTTRRGGAHDGGTVFRMDADGTVTTIHDFQSPDGTDPIAALIQASDGFLYGTTTSGTENYFGTIFRIDYSGTGFSTVHVFSGPDGRASYASLTQGLDGSLVGTAFMGGALNGGTVFRLTLPAAFLAVSGIVPSSGPAAGGAAVSVAGSGFVTGATGTIGGAALSNPSVTVPTQLLGATPTLPPGTFHDVTVTNPDQTSATLHGGYLADFLDVPADDLFHGGVASILRAGITAGCGDGLYCRNAIVTRAQMAVFLVKAIAGAAYQPPPATGTMFSDVPAGSFAANWIEDFATRGITAGCGGGNYCPSDPVSRAQMAVFLLKSLLTPAYVPPAPTGHVFGDVPVDAFAAAWIEDLAGRGITAGCGGGLYCPGSSSTRGQMAVFLQRTFSLP
jgi:uncharacterized repeat protein (TIGR03803 family)